MNYYNKLIAFCCLVAFTLSMAKSVSAKVNEHDVRELVVSDSINYKETTDDVPNPGRGFYEPKCIRYSVSGNSMDTYAPALYHMRLDISQFAGAYNDEHKDIELSEDMLDALDATLDNLEKKHSCAIIRFAYDPGFGGKDTIHEPSIEMINKHQAQLGEVLTKHESCIVSLEVGLFGKWGEMHSGDKCNAENFNKAISKWLEVLPDSIPISVRTPGYYADWAGIERSKLNEDVTVKGTDAYRVGIYNDGYLGTYNDSGTYADRDVEIAWLDKQARHTLYGGEIVLNDNKGTVKNTAAYMETEAFSTHTSYLNIAWNDKVIAAMQKEDYSGSDPLYKGKTGFDYVRNHLGYRFVVRGVKLTSTTTSFEDFCVEADIENVGFANVIKDKYAVLVFAGDENTYYIPVDKNTVDPNGWNSKITSKVRAVCDLPGDMPLGNYKVYLRVASDTDSIGLEGYPIRFANADKESDGLSVSVWDETLGANYLGDVCITDILPEAEDENDQNGQEVNNQQPPQEQPTQDQPAQEQAVQDQSKQEQPAQEQPSQEYPMQEQPAADDNSSSSAPIGMGVQVGDKIVGYGPDKSYGQSMLVTSVNYKKRIGTVTVVWMKSNTKTLEIPDEFVHYGMVMKVTAIGDKACVDNKKATTVIIGKNVKKIGKKAFYGLNKCMRLTIKSTYLLSKKVGKNAFGRMNKIKKVSIPKKKRKAYSKWLYKKGLAKKVTTNLT